MRAYRRGDAWWLDARFDGRRHRFPGLATRAATEALGRKLEELYALRAAGAKPDANMEKWLASLPVSLLEKLTELDLIGIDRVGMADSLNALVEQFKGSLSAAGRTERHINETAGKVLRVAAAIGSKNLRGLTIAGLEKWFFDRQKDGMAANTRNGYRQALVELGNWAKRVGILSENHFIGLQTACVKADRRHVRRALTVHEAERLLWATILRPLAEYGRESMRLPGSKRSNWKLALPGLWGEIYLL